MAAHWSPNMRISIHCLFATSLLAATAAAQPAPAVTTQACLGELATFLTCPAGSRLSGTECRAVEPHHGQADGEHWSGSKRSGPAVFLRDGDPSKPIVSFAANYRDHKKTGRVFRFDDQGRLESFSDVMNDEDHGLSVTCLPNGRVSYLGYYKKGKSVGMSRAWKERDGSFSYAFEYDAQGRGQQVQTTPALEQRPDQLCHPARCDVMAKPDLSGVPK
ncbi:MAG: hypothetical protein H6Q90_4270 [Deltaproteobacteria bacterium]|nr:hypothetical protein [Deltaproteobacteria bacterium]